MKLVWFWFAVMIMCCLMLMAIAFIVGHDHGKGAADKWYAAHGYVKMPTVLADTTKPGYCRAVLVDPDTHKEIIWSEVPNATYKYPIITLPSNDGIDIRKWGKR